MTSVTTGPSFDTEPLVWHIHYQSWSRDCDGKYEGSWDDWDKDFDSKMRTWTEEEAFNRALLRLSHSRPEFGQTIAVEVVDENGDYAYLTCPKERPRTRIKAHMDTDEGYRDEQATICANPLCEEAPTTFRDFTAEAAGY
jgi:hypothetical protein